MRIAFHKVIVAALALLAPATGRGASAFDDFTTLASFGGTNGQLPRSGVVLDAAGNLYGTTSEGGSSDLGVVYRLSAAGALTVLHEFSGADGANPVARLAIDPRGNLYGTTSAGDGTIFKVAADGTFSTLYSFSGLLERF